MPGPEKQLQQDLIDTVWDRACTDTWQNYLDDHTPAGSANWRTLAIGIGIWEQMVRRHPDGPDARDWLLVEMDVQRERFMQTESFSRIYATWHLVPMLACFAAGLYRNDEAIQAEVGDWLRTFWAIFGLGAGIGPEPDRPGRMVTYYAGTFTGSRSWAGSPPNHSGPPHHITHHALCVNAAWAAGLSGGGPTAERGSGDQDFTDDVVRGISRKIGRNATAFHGLTTGAQQILASHLRRRDQADSLFAWIGHHPVQPYLIVQTAKDSMTLCEDVGASVSTDALPVLVARGQSDGFCRLEPLSPFDARRGGDTAGTAGYEGPGGTIWASALNTVKAGAVDPDRVTMAGLRGEEIHRTMWGPRVNRQILGGAAERPEPPEPTEPPPTEAPEEREDIPLDVRGHLNSILVHADALQDMSDEDSIQMARNKGAEVERLAELALYGEELTE